MSTTKQMSFAPLVSDHNMVLTPSTAAGSDASLSPSSRRFPKRALHRKWSGSTSKSSASTQWSSSSSISKQSTKQFQQQPEDTLSQASKEKMPDKPSSRKNKNVLKRAIHKIKKRTTASKQSSGSLDGTSGSEAAPATERAKLIQQSPPNVDNLGIDPRLVEKWKARKELKKQESVTGERAVVSRSTSTLVIVGLSSGSYAWIKGKTQRFIDNHEVVLVAFLVAAAVGAACMLFLDRCI